MKILFLFLLLAVTLHAEIRTMAVLDLSGTNLSQTEIHIATQKLEGELVKLADFDVIERGKMDEIIAEQAIQLSGCVTSSCAVEVGKILGATHMITGVLGLVDGVYWIQIKVVDVETTKIIAHIQRDIDLPFRDLLLETVPTIAKEIAALQE